MASQKSPCQIRKCRSLTKFLSKIIIVTSSRNSKMKKKKLLKIGKKYLKVFS